MISADRWIKAAQVLNTSTSIGIGCHVSPDGDALGSMLGLGGFLRRLGKKVWMGWGAPELAVPGQYQFLPGLDGMSPPAEFPESLDAFVAIDCADLSRLEELMPKFRAAGMRMNIDHHVSNPSYADVNLVDSSRASSCEIAFELVARMGGVPTADEATCFYTGIVTDSGRFQYASTTPQTLRLAADLRELGVDHVKVASEVFESSSFEYLRVLGVVLSRAAIAGNLLWSWIKPEDLDGLVMEETEHFIDAIRVVKDMEVVALLKGQNEGGWKVSLRSRGAVDVSKVARLFGGGGHSRAAGYTTQGSAEEVAAAIIKAVTSPQYAATP